MHNKVILIITDGVGHSDKKEYNAFHHARKPHYDYLFEHIPNSLIRTYGESVGLPDNQMGNSEVGHMSLGSGRVLYQDLVKINYAIQNKQLQENPALKTTLQNTTTLHLSILASDGGVHAHINHLKALIEIAKQANKKIWLHLIADGRDVTPQSFLEHIKILDDVLCPSVQIATVSGRFYAMDRDSRWDRIKQAYDVMVHANNLQTISIESYINAQYTQGIFDEFIVPASFNNYQGMQAKTFEDKNAQMGASNHIGLKEVDSKTEGFVFLNYRSDRARELIASLGLKDFTYFKRNFLPNILLTCMCEYDEKFPFQIMFPKEKITNTLAEIISKQGLKQAHIAETEKYAHVTFFFNGGREEEFEGEVRLLIESPKVKTYDLQPEMSANEVANNVCACIEQAYDFIVVNFANGDMVGHTGNFEAAIKAIEAIDREIARIWKLAKQKGYSVIMTSDHGNCEEMKDKNLKPLTNHTVGDVFCFIDSKNVQKIHDGTLSNIAPSILKLMNITIPKEMDEALF